MDNEFSRRAIMRGVAALAGTSMLSAASPAQSVNAATPIQLGLASYTFRQFDRARLIGFMKDLNILNLNAKNVRDHLPSEPGEEAKALADYSAAGIRLHAIGTVDFSKSDETALRSNFEYAKRANVTVIVAGDPTPESLPRIASFAKEYDIRIAIHNHGPENKFWPSPLDVLKAVNGLDPRLGCCIDVGHTVRAGGDVVHAIQAAGPRLFNIHMKDLSNFQSKESQVAVGEGRIPVRDIFAALDSMKYQGYVDLEYEIHADDPMPGAIASFAYMRGVLAGMS
jgi:sugar phosphate isomerase/epimerase